MSKLKHLIFKSIVIIYKVIPFNNYISLFLKWIGVGKHKIYKDLKFSGKFQILFNHDQIEYKFKMIHFGGKIENETFWKGLFKTFEPESGDIWIEFSKISNVIFDIGANSGIYSLVSKTVNKNSEIYSFEPSISTYTKFLKNITLNNLQINHYQIALGENDGEQIFYDFKIKNQTSASLSPEKSRGINSVWPYKVKTYKLDSYIEEFNISAIDLIKLDVEMYEPQVLNGFSKYINNFLPVIFIEVLTDEIATQIYPIIKENYFIYQLKTNSTISKTENFTIVDFVWNYLLIPKSKINKYDKLISKFEK